MTKFITNISLESEVAFNPKYQDLVKKKILSRTINGLLKEYLQIDETRNDYETAEDIDDRLKRLQAEVVSLSQQRDSLIAKEKEESERYTVIEGAA